MAPETGFSLWPELARRDFLMGVAVAGSWLVFEGVERWVVKMELRGRGRALGQRRMSGAPPTTSANSSRAEEGGPLLAHEASDDEEES